MQKHKLTVNSFTCRWCWSCCAHSRWCCRCSACPAGPAAACWSYCQICWWWLQSLRLTGGRPRTRLKTEATRRTNTNMLTWHLLKPKAAVFVLIAEHFLQHTVFLFKDKFLWSHGDECFGNTFVVSLFLSASSACSLWEGGPAIVPCSKERRSNLMLWVKRYKIKKHS